MATDTSEAGLEKLIVAQMTAAGWLPGDPKEFDWAWSVDLAQLRDFMEATQPKVAAAL
jgi:type I restriction enzyme R subunit